MPKVKALAHRSGCRITFEPKAHLVEVISTREGREPITWTVGTELARAWWRAWKAEGFSEVE